MTTLLYIQASPRHERSHSITVADEFLAAYKQCNPADRVVIYNVFEAPLPSFDGLTIQAKYTILHGQQHSKEELEAWRGVEKIIEQFKSADKYLLAVPMWNFSIPYRLKQYIDILVQPTYTFNYDPDAGYSGLVTGKPLAVVYARGGEYSPGSGSEEFDFQKIYVKVLFEFIGFTDIRSIIFEPTLQGTPEQIAAKRQETINLARQIAAEF